MDCAQIAVISGASSSLVVTYDPKFSSNKQFQLQISYWGKCAISCSTLYVEVKSISKTPTQNKTAHRRPPCVREALGEAVSYETRQITSNWPADMPVFQVPSFSDLFPGQVSSLVT